MSKRPGPFFYFLMEVFNMTQRVAITIGSHNGNILARADRNAEKSGGIQLFDFVRIGRIVGRIVKIEDGHDFTSDTEISRIAAVCLASGRESGLNKQNQLYKKLTIEPLGEILPGGELSEQDIIDFCKDKIADYKVPKEVAFLDALPRNVGGKVLKRELRDR